MSPLRLFHTAATVAVLAGALSGCDRLHFGNSREGVSPAQQAACRQRTEESFTAHNRGEIYHNENLSGMGSASPFSAGSTATASSDSLSTRYAYDRQLTDCYNSSPDPVPGADGNSK